MKYIILICVCLLISTTCGYTEWEKHDKILLGTYLVGEVCDVLQTTSMLNKEGWTEMNPLIKDDTDLLISAVVTTSIIIWMANHFEDNRTDILIGCNAVKWSFIISNHNAGVRIVF